MGIGFIIGSPRSGTTVLGNILNKHSRIAEWYEPYYMWSYFIGVKNDDVWYKTDLTEKAKKRIYKEFEVYKKKTGKPMVVEKTPGHAFHIEVVMDVFPKAKFVHLVRDGRDVTLSISKEWAKREHMVAQKRYDLLAKTVVNMLRRQPYYRYKLMALIHEILSNRSVNPKMYLNKSKWQGKPYWGPRFSGWQEFLESHSKLQFNAMQWVSSLESVHSDWPKIPAGNKLEIRYEDLVRYPESTLTSILNFLGHDLDQNFFKKIPKLNSNNFGKWKQEFTQSQISEIKHLLSPLTEKLGYTDEDPW